MKQYIIFAGVNGAGKFTLYDTISIYQQMSRIITDEILEVGKLAGQYESVPVCRNFL